jgi:hypothetical protein
LNKEIYVLCRRYWRLDRRVNMVRGDCLNFAWYAAMDDVFEVLDRFKNYGINVETYPYLDKETPEGKLILATL